MLRRTFLTTSLSAAAVAGSAALAAPRAHAVTTTADIPQLGWDAPDLVNPGRGQYDWQPISRATDRPKDWLFPQGTRRWDLGPAWPGARDLYLRLDWRHVEKGEGNFDFAKIDEFLAWGEAHDQRLTLRVMPVHSGSPDLRADGVAQALPDYMLGRVGDWIAEVNGERTVVPDWNNSYYLSRVESLLAELGRRYDRDDRLWAIDLMGHGNWGEWHDHPYAEQGHVRPAGRGALTEASMRRIVDANFRAFGSTHVLALTANVPALRYTLQSYPHAGLRVDSLGDPAGGWAWPRMHEVPWTQDRWRYAPVVVEYCSTKANTTTPETFTSHFGEGDDAFWATMAADAAPTSLYEVARRQVLRHHVSMVSSGNHHLAWDGATPGDGDPAAIAAAYRSSGYRYSVVRARVDRESPTRFVVRTTWRNAGIAPTYDRWEPELVVKDAAGRVVLTQPLQLDLHWLVSDQTPEGAAWPTPKDADVWCAIDTGQTPAPGTYTICVRVNLPVQKAGATRTMRPSFYRPLALAQRGRQDDGCYPLVTITV